jgi:hypothetical protein
VSLHKKKRFNTVYCIKALFRDLSDNYSFDLLAVFRGTLIRKNPTKAKAARPKR